MRKVTNVFLGITCFFLFIGFLFKFQHWPGATVAFLFGSLLSIPSMLLYFITRYKYREEAKISKYFVYFYFFIMVIGINFFIGNGSRDLLNAFTMLEHSSQKINEQMAQNAEGLKVNLSPAQKKYCVNVQELCFLIDEDKKSLIEMTGGFDADGIPLGKDNQDVASTYFRYEKNNAEHLIDKLERLNTLASEIMGVGSDKIIFEDIQAQSSPFEPDVKISWASKMSEHLPLSSVLANLELLKTRALQNQLTILNSNK